MFAEELRRAVEVAPRERLSELSAALWKALSSDLVTEAQAEELSAAIEARKAVRPAPTSPRRRSGSRPRTDASMERRRRWAASGRLPPQLAARFTLAEQAVLAVVALEVVKRGDCRLFHDHIAAVAGVSRSTVRATLRRARDLGVITVEERRRSAWRNDSSVLRIVSLEWQAWNALVRRPPWQGGGANSPTTTTTRDSRREAASPSESDAKGIRREERGRPAPRPSQEGARIEAWRASRRGERRG